MRTNGPVDTVHQPGGHSTGLSRLAARFAELTSDKGISDEAHRAQTLLKAMDKPDLFTLSEESLLYYRMRDRVERNDRYYQPFGTWNPLIGSSRKSTT